MGKLLPLSPGEKLYFSKMITVDQSNISVERYTVLFGMCPKSPQQTYKMPEIDLRSLQRKK